MRINRIYIEEFKNLKDFRIDFNSKEMKSVLIGENATGKSNLIEAIIIIFKYLDLESKPTGKDNFTYSIDYTCYDNSIHISYNGAYEFYSRQAGPNDTADEFDISKYEKMYNKEFYQNKDQFLPKYVITYYSGVSDRLKEHFYKHQSDFYSAIIKEDFDDQNIDSLRRLFYVQMVHAYYVLLAFFSFEKDFTESKHLLSDFLDIEDLKSVLFKIKNPKKKWKGDPRFFGTFGLVQSFLSKLWDEAIAPIYNTENSVVSFNKSTEQEILYLYIGDVTRLKYVAKDYSSNTGFFKALESTYMSDILDEVRIKVKKKNVDGITFRDLSEGEKQLITVLGIIKFTQDKETLILLDEPDTHLNPLWKWQYLSLLDKIVLDDDTIQIIINTHDPLVIGSLKKEQVRIFQQNQEGVIRCYEPDFDPQGLGVDGILTSDLFKLPTTLDMQTQELLNKRNRLIMKYYDKEISQTDIEELKAVSKELNSKYGFYSSFRDPTYQKVLKALDKEYPFDVSYETSFEETQKQQKLMEDIIKKIKEKEESEIH